MKKNSSQFREKLFGSQEIFIKPFFLGLLHLLLNLYFNRIIVLHPNVDGTFLYTWTKY